MTLDLIENGVNIKQTWDTVLTFLYFINFFIIEVMASCFFAVVDCSWSHVIIKLRNLTKYIFFVRVQEEPCITWLTCSLILRWSCYPMLLRWHNWKAHNHDAYNAVLQDIFCHGAKWLVLSSSMPFCENRTKGMNKLALSMESNGPSIYIKIWHHP